MSKSLTTLALIIAILGLIIDFFMYNAIPSSTGGVVFSTILILGASILGVISYYQSKSSKEKNSYALIVLCICIILLIISIYTSVISINNDMQYIKDEKPLNCAVVGGFCQDTCDKEKTYDSKITNCAAVNKICCRPY